MSTGVDEQTSRSLEDWRRRLIDLSHRNRLIAYRETQGTTLQIVAPEVGELVPDSDREHAAAWDFYFPPEVSTRRGDVSDAATRVDTVVVRSRRRRSSRQLKFSESNPQRIARMLDNLAKRSNEEFQDKALRTLYIAAGFLDWHDAHSGKDITSPLVLIPVALRRESAREPYRLFFVDDEDIVVNPSLTEKLRRDSTLELPGDWSWEDKPLLEELDEIRRAVDGKGWSVREDAVLSLFSFQKYVMYRDLLDNERRAGVHPLVRSLAHGRLLDELRVADHELPDPRRLDDEQKPAETLSILDADASQRRCIEAAKQGRSFVMQGPPGTGKSQTIANLIAEAIGQERRVLFVSEKAAALDVVFNRLAARGLDEYCLKLHSEHAGRRDVVQALNRSLTSRLVARQAMPPDDMERLAELRGLLNETAEALHSRHSVLGGRTVREVHEELARLDDAPSAPGAPEPSDAGGEAVLHELSELTECFERLVERWRVTPRDFPWRGYLGERFTVDDRGRAITVLRALANAAEMVGREARGVAAAIDWPEPQSYRDAERVADLAVHLAGAEDLEPGWLDVGGSTLERAAREAEQVYDELAVAEQDFSETYGLRSLADFPSAVLGRVQAARDEVSRCCGPASGWERELERLPEALQALDDLPRLLRDAESRAAAIRPLLGQPDAPTDREQLTRLADLAQLAARDEHRPEPSWLGAGSTDRARQALEAAEPDLLGFRSRRAELLEQWRPGALALDAHGLAERLASARPVVSRLTATYRRDARSVKAARVDGRLPPSEELRRIVEAQQLGARIDARSEYLQQALGRYATGRETDPPAVRRAIATAERALELSAPGADAGRLGDAVGGASNLDPRYAEADHGLRAVAGELAARLRSLGRFVSLPDAVLLELRLDDVRLLADRAAEPVRALAALVKELDAESIAARNLTETERRAATVERLREVRRVESTSRDRWRATLGQSFARSQTPWERISRAARWLDGLEVLIAGAQGSPLRARLGAGDRDWPGAADLRRANSAMQDAAVGLAALFGPERTTEITACCEKAPLTAVGALCDLLTSRVDDLYDWTDWCGRRRRAESLGWADFVKGLIDQETPGSKVVAAFQRTYWNRRLEALYNKHPDLAEDLRRAAFQRWVDEFRRLDRQLVQTGPDRLIARREDGRAAHVAVAGGEVELLKREVNKSRRHRPVRDLLARIPGLLSELKPCLMMSPLSVSHYLPPHHEFDIVVFDEASQVPPQDAINCIYRGKQLVVAGDSRQLPPTSFFQVAELDEPGDSETAERVEEDMESVLDACASLLPPLPLEWHYRSRSEPLIAFSNHRIYDDKLVTFPSTEDESSTRGVGFIHVPDGVYDRGRTATNRREAQVVAERVAQHLLERSDRSVGVIAFNVAQAAAISEELDLLRSERPALEQHFRRTSRLDEVFVKHLEAVQGDERDVIVLSVGYGRDAGGRFTSNFGPLNAEGGHRRLNVAVTRARERLEVVASVRSHEFSLTDTASAGSRMLREYLAYAEHDGRFSGAPEATREEARWASAIEEAIAAAVADFGYEVVPNVGVGVFRIDIGVRGRGDAGRFILGIETDGDAYERTPTARDRERLRHEVLERLGWGPIHRIWSLDWVRNRNSEIDRLGQALEAAEAHAEREATQTPRQARAQRAPQPPRRVERVVHEIVDGASAAALPWTTTYRRASLRAAGAGKDFTARANRRSQAGMLIRLVTVEGPVAVAYAIRRVGDAWGVDRLGARGLAAASEAIADAAGRGKLDVRGDFLWPPGHTLTHVRIPVAGDPVTRRDFDEIPPEEIDLAITRLRDGGGGASDERLPLQVARVFGFERVGTRMRDLIERRLRQSAAGDEAT